MTWSRLGHVYAPDGSLPWARSYAANPVAEHIEGDLFRIYFSTRDEKNRSSVGFVEIDIAKPGKILRVADQPILTPGDLAMFDDSGASIGCITKVGDKRYLYYMGWHLTVSVPWQNAIGLAISTEANGPFMRHARFPVFPLGEDDPYTISYPWVSIENGKFRMWYGSNIAWGPVKEDMRHLIKYAESHDGIHWTSNNQIAIGFSGSVCAVICQISGCAASRSLRLVSEAKPASGRWNSLPRLFRVIRSQSRVRGTPKSQLKVFRLPEPQLCTKPAGFPSS